MVEGEMVAAKLTDAQKEAVLRLSAELRGPRTLEISTQRLLPLMDLWRSQRGTEPPIQLVRRDYSDWPRLHWTYGLTTLGLAVRAHLLKDQSND